MIIDAHAHLDLHEITGEDYIHLMDASGVNKVVLLASLYFEQALFLHFEEGKECFDTLQESKRCQLRDYQYSGIVKKVEIRDAGDSSCAKCQALRGKVFTVAEALESMPIPIRDCANSYGYCRCRYSPIVE